ncbi:DUF3857 domain-containing protein [Pedobacter sp. P351]|uniref:DUF3857 domain-containing protein n=1 Tax=Pedobacter superstes TaxID=3133441 RepID=UPI0030A99C73
MKHFLLSGALALSSTIAFAQDFAFAKVSSQEFELKKYDKDANANAVVLKEFGNAYISSSDGELVFDYHIRIKIFNSKGFKHGNVEIPIGKSDANTFEKIRDIKAITFYPDENNLIRSSELDPKQIFKESKAGKYHDLTKFALPNLRDGCIIEYKYTIQSPFIRTFRSWDFQSDIPKVSSEYCAVIPAVYNYNVSLRGPYKLTKSTGILEKDCFQPGGGFKADCSKMTYAMADIPAFVEEDYMTAASNFKSAMYFELSDYTDYRGTKHQLSKEWKDVDRDLKTEEYFGAQLKKKDFFKDKITPVIEGKTTELDKAKAIYSFMQGWFKWNNFYGKYSDQGVKKAFENHSGSSADINLALVTAINSAGLKAEPVLLSTRRNGLISDLFPVLTEFDYVICNVTIGETSYLLDATDPMLPFGLLPLRCINDKGRLINFDKPSSWIDLKASQKESKTLNLDLILDEEGKITGKMIVLSAGYEGYNKRYAIKKFNSTDEYVEDLDERYPKIKFSKAEIVNMDSLEKPLQELYEIEIKSQNNGHVNINPYFMNKITENPFKLTERTYPVDMGAPSETKVIMVLKFPEKFEVISKPPALALSLPNNGGRLLTQSTLEGNTLLVSYNMQLKNSIYSSEEYHYLKEFYNKIIQTQQADIILKKKL